MRSASLVFVLLLAACPGKSSAPPQNPDNPAGEAGFFDVLTVAGARWVLHDTVVEGPSPELAITVADVREVGGAKVVRLTSTVTYPDGEPEAQPEMLLGVSSRGVWMLSVDMDDAAIAAELAASPHWPSPPVEIENEVGRYMNTWDASGEKVACIGEIPDLGGEDCPDVCGGGMCVAERGGLVQIDAQWSPDPYAIYAQDGYRPAGGGE